MSEKPQKEPEKPSNEYNPLDTEKFYQDLQEQLVKIDQLQEGERSAKEEIQTAMRSRSD